MTVEGTVTVGGLLFQLKGVNIPPHAKITVDVHRPHTVIDPVDESGDTGVLDGFSVTILSPSGSVLEQRADARAHLQNASVSTKWDRLNLVYFLGYAFWGYFLLPSQLTRPEAILVRQENRALTAQRLHARGRRPRCESRPRHLRAQDVQRHPVPSKRRVKMSLAQDGWVLPFPDFITIDVERWQLR